MEVDRRTSLGLLGIGASLVLGGQAATAAGGPRQINTILFDGRFEEARALAATWRERGALTIDVTQQDIGHAWRGEVAQRLVRQPGMIAGATLYADYIISLGMGRERGLRQVHLQSHPAVKGGARLFHWVLA